MLAGTRHHTRARRGIVLVLVLAMLGLLALIGVTFATFSGQARINARNFAQSVIQPQDDELMDFALQQLITDTGDLRSAIRGHSLARDMFGNDAFNNGYLAANPVTGGNLLITEHPGVHDRGRRLRRADEHPDPGRRPGDVRLQLHPVDHAGLVHRHHRLGQPHARQPDVRDPGRRLRAPTATSRSSAARAITPSASACSIRRTLVQSQTARRARSPGSMPNHWTVLNNPTLGYISYNQYNPFPGWPIAASNAAQTGARAGVQRGNVNNVAFTLDGRWLHAFNGPGMGTQFNVTVTDQRRQLYQRHDHRAAVRPTATSATTA